MYDRLGKKENTATDRHEKIDGIYKHVKGLSNLSFIIQLTVAPGKEMPLQASSM